jgi:hypothetical protein
MVMATGELVNGHAVGTKSASLMALQHSVQITKSGLLFARAPSLSSWEDIGRYIISVADSSTWWIADWLVYGEDTFKDRYVEAIEKTSLNYQTLRNYAWVARRFGHSRRRDKLSFGHHSEVAALDAPEQDYWLRKAEEFSWSRNELRRQVRASLRERGNLPVEPSGGAGSEATRRGNDETELSEPRKTLRLVLTSDQITLFERTAETHNMELREWALTILESAARSGS